jgi:hypothetical protein
VLLVAAAPVSVALTQSFGSARPGFAEASQRESLRATCFFCLAFALSVLALWEPVAASVPVELVPLMLDVPDVPLREDELLSFEDDDVLSFDVDVAPLVDAVPLVWPLNEPLVEPLVEPEAPFEVDPL